MSLRFEVFPADLDRAVDFYTRVLGFELRRDERSSANPYVSMVRGGVQVGAAPGPAEVGPGARQPPVAVELVLEIDDVAAERDRVVAQGWPLEEELQDRPWGLTDFRLLDPDGHLLRVTSR